MRNEDRPVNTEGYEQSYGQTVGSATAPQEVITLVKGYDGHWGAVNKTKDYVLESLGPDEMLACMSLIILGVSGHAPLKNWARDLHVEKMERDRHERVKKLLKDVREN